MNPPIPPGPLHAILDRAKRGDAGAEQELFQHLSVRFRVFARQRVGDPDLAEDVAQEATITVLKKYRDETFRVGFEEWTWGVLHTHIRNQLHRLSTQKKRLVRGAVAGVGTQAASSANPDLERRLVDCLRKICGANRRYARALNLVHQGYTTDEISQKLGMSRNALYVTLHRARAMLRLCLDTGGIRDERV